MVPAVGAQQGMGPRCWENERTARSREAEEPRPPLKKSSLYVGPLQAEQVQCGLEHPAVGKLLKPQERSATLIICSIRSVPTSTPPPPYFYHQLPLLESQEVDDCCFPLTVS